MPILNIILFIHNNIIGTSVGKNQMANLICGCAFMERSLGVLRVDGFTCKYFVCVGGTILMSHSERYQQYAKAYIDKGVM